MRSTDSHLHEFEIAEEHYGIPDLDDPFVAPVVSEARAQLGKGLDGVASFGYAYDFDGDWGNKIEVEKIGFQDTCATRSTLPVPTPVCHKTLAVRTTTPISSKPRVSRANCSIFC